MDISELLLNQPVAAEGAAKPGGAIHRGAGVDIDVEDERCKKIARDFESIFIREILKRMKDTIPESEMEDSSSKQIKSMYWSFMADAIADKGGFGLWKQIYEVMPKVGPEGAKEAGAAAMEAGREQESQVGPQRLDKSV